MKKNYLHEILIEYNRIFKDTDEIYHTFAKNYGLSDCAFWIFYMLRETDSQYTQSDICDMLCMPRQSVNSAIKSLEKEGYIELRPAENNKKNKILYVTEKGTDFTKKSVDKVIDAEIKALEGFSQDELEFFLDLSRKYAHLLRNEAEKSFKSH